MYDYGLGDRILGIDYQMCTGLNGDYYFADMDGLRKSILKTCTEFLGVPAHIFQGDNLASNSDGSMIWKQNLDGSPLLYDPIQWSGIFKTYEDFIYKPSRINQYSKQAKLRFALLAKEYRRKTGIVTRLKGFR